VLVCVRAARVGRDLRIFGLDINWRPKAEPGEAKALQPIDNRGGWLSLVREPFVGAWQRDIAVRVENVLTYTAVFSCITLIANDIAKLRLRLVKQDDNGIWQEVEANSPFWPVLRRPNRYSNRIQFIAQWITSKLVFGNTYVLKERDARGVVTALYLLNPPLVTVLVADDGSVYYELSRDNLSGLQDQRLVVPAREVIHDIYFAPYHPLCGMSPIRACGLAATQGLEIQRSSTRFFERGAKPAGILTAPGHINAETALRLKEYWENNYTGDNAGRTAVLGDGLKYEQLVMTADDAQLIDQLKWTAETVCSAFHVPAHMVGIGQPPTYNNIEALNQQYYSQCLQSLIESIELLLDEGLELPKPLGTEFELDGLLRMDTKTKTEAARQAIQSGVSPNEIRRKYFDLGPVAGGETPYLQEQQWPLRHLAERPLPSQRPVTEPEPLPTVADEAEARSSRTIRQAVREFHRLADRDRMNGKISH
jgi:HK97 family phage portal protein